MLHKTQGEIRIRHAQGRNSVNQKLSWGRKQVDPQLIQGNLPGIAEVKQALDGVPEALQAVDFRLQLPVLLGKHVH